MKNDSVGHQMENNRGKVRHLIKPMHSNCILNVLYFIRAYTATAMRALPERLRERDELLKRLLVIVFL